MKRPTSADHPLSFAVRFRRTAVAQRQGRHSDAQNDGAFPVEMMTTKAVLLLAALTFVAGCAGKTVLMRNEAGDIQKCEVSTTGAVLGGVIARDMSLKNCEKEWSAAGYKRITNE